jgi:dephospho-CoA kinase
MLGGIGAGKSHVARRAAALAPGHVVDADAIAHEALRLFARDGRLAEAVGAEFVKDGAPDVEALGARAFTEPALLRKLERLIHPHCHSAIREAIRDHREGSGAPLLVLDVALLIEVGLDRQCDALWYVEVPDDLRTERAGHRGLSLEQLQRREAFQSPKERKRARADLVIRNDVDPDALDRQILAGLDSLGIGPGSPDGPVEGAFDGSGAAQAIDPQKRAL